MSQPENIREKWLKQLAVLREEIASMPEGPAREAAVYRAQQLENATQMEELLNSRPPRRKPPE